ncbi:sensor histidine kinase [Luteimicrobium sp. DT211]|uniref:sensor histidine kinase n=1 Tax=Luteimicrobium sp. DT211 TaxID=3393412 RepID=UPI003CEEA6F7
MNPTGARSLRARITATTAAVTLLGAVALTGVVWFVLDRVVAADARSALADRTATVSAGLTVDGSDVTLDTSAARDATVWLFAPDGARVEGPSGGDLDAEAAAVARDPGADPTEWHDWLLQAEDVTGSDDVLVVALPIGGYESTKHLAALLTALVGVVVVAAVTGLTAWSTRRALAPVTGMAREAAAWSAADLDRRFGLGPPRDEITELGSVLDGLLDRAAQAIRSEQRLTAELAHEIRTPLTVIRAEAELAAMDATARGASTERLDQIVASVDTLTGVVTTLLAVSRGERVVDAQVPVDDVVRAAVALAAPPEHAEVAVDAAPGVVVAVPLEVASQALSPVVANAFRYARSRVRVAARVTGDHVEVTVEDDGPGVDPDAADEIFEPGRRGPGSPGAGLGLPLARRVARLAGGDVRLDRPRPARFVVALPSGRTIPPGYTSGV